MATLYSESDEGCLRRTRLENDAVWNDAQWDRIIGKTTLRPRILGGPAACEKGVSQMPHDEDVQRVLAEVGRTDSWRAYTGEAIRSLTDILATNHKKLHAHFCSSGTVAVELGLKGLGVGPGDEVLMCAYDFRGNFGNICHLGATPVLVDMEAHSGQIDVSRLAGGLSDKTRAVVVSHLHGGSVDMAGVRVFADAHGVGVLEDVCQSPRAIVQGRRAGEWGDVSTFSFGGSKLISAGRGGALVTSREDVMQRIRVYTNRGNDAYPMSELQAAIVLPQWTALDQVNQARSRGARLLCEGLRRCDVKSLIPWTTAFDDAAFYKFGFWYDASACEGLSREGFSGAVRAEGVALDPGFRALHLSHARKRFRAVGELEQATRADDAVLTLHHPVLLGDEGELADAVAAVVKVERHAAELALGSR